MTDVLVLQSHRDDVPAWIEHCMGTVRAWAQEQGFAYRKVGDELFADVPEWFAAKVAGRMPILADLGRLQQMQHLLKDARRVVWLDADTLILAAPRCALRSDAPSLFGYEYWIQANAKGRPRCYHNVSNAFLSFTAASSALPFLLDASLSIIQRADAAHIAPQMIGPKLVSSLHSIAGFTVDKRFGALSPEVAGDVLSGGGPFLDAYLTAAGTMQPALNLCASLVGEGLSERDMPALIEALCASA